LLSFRHGLLFCPFLPLIAAIKNILIFAIKSVSEKENNKFVEVYVSIEFFL
jgi:hypothetical protein